MLQITSKGSSLCQTFFPQVASIQGSGKGQRVLHLVQLLHLLSQSCLLKPSRSCLLPLWQQAFLMVRLRVLLGLFIHLSGSSIWVARRQGALLVSLEVFRGFLGRRWMSGLPWKVMFSTLHLWVFLRTPVQNPLGWRTMWWEQLRTCLYSPTHSSAKRKMEQAVKNCLLKHLLFISRVSPALPG